MKEKKVAISATISQRSRAALERDAEKTGLSVSYLLDKAIQVHYKLKSK